jgi:hypothetical protein
MIVSSVPVRLRWFASMRSFFFAGVALWAGAILSACGGAQTNVPEPQTSGGAGLSSDAGLPPPVSSRRGVIVPSDTAIGSMPSEGASSTGTSGRSASPIVGNPGGGGN